MARFRDFDRRSEVTVPNGAAGIVADIEWAVQHGALETLVDRTQDAVIAAQAAEIQLSAAWNAATVAVWDGLQRGVPLVLAIIQAMIQRLFATVETFPGVSEALDFIEQVPGVTQLQGLLSTAVDQFDGTANAVADALINADGTVTASFEAQLVGAVDVIINNADGTASGLAKLFTRGDGTAIFAAPAALNSSGSSLLDGGDGTAQSIASAMQNLVNPVGVSTYMQQGWNTLLGQTGLDSPEQLVASLGGLIPAALDNLDGTALQTRFSNIVQNLDGTATLIQQTTSNSVAALIDSADGTAMSGGAALLNTANTLAYAAGNWQTVLTNTGLLDVGELATALTGMIPATLDNFDGTALPTTQAQLIANLDGTASLLTNVGNSAVNTLVDNVDGTAVPLITSIQNAANAAISQ